MIGVIVQARTGSSRFPRKIYEDLNGKAAIQRVLGGVTDNCMPEKIVLAMPKYDEVEFNMLYHQGFFEECIDYRFATYFGHDNDLISRYHQAAKQNGVDLIVRITADCPFGGTLIDPMLKEYVDRKYNGYMSGTEQICKDKAYQDGVDCEIFPMWLLEEAMDSNDPYYHEHVTPYMYRVGVQNQLYRYENTEPNETITNKFYNFSFDTDEDRKLIIEICKNFDVLSGRDYTSQAKRLDAALRNTSFPGREWTRK